MRLNKPPPAYHTYLITVWEERYSHDKSQWRYRLEDPSTGQSKLFSSPEALWSDMARRFKTEQRRDLD